MKHLLLVILSIYATLAQTQLTFHQALGDHMVIQEKLDYYIYGYGNNGDNVTIDLNGESVSCKVVDGKWSAQLSGRPSGGPYDITATNGKEKIVLRDVYFGWVFLCGGQSNMEWPTSAIHNSQSELADAAYPMIRMITVEKSLSNQPLEALASSGWHMCSSEVAKDFSAIGFLTARNLYKEYGIPIGLIDNAWGGSEIDTWMSEELFDDKPVYMEQITKYKTISDQDQEDAESQLQEWRMKVADEDKGIKEQWQYLTDFEEWQDIKVPGHWEDEVLPNYNGVAWYAITFQLDKIPSKASCALGKIDDGDYTYINGNLVGSMQQSYNINRVYDINPTFLKKGKNTLTIKVVDTGGGGGITGSQEDLYIEVDGRKIYIDGTWKIKPSTMHYPYPTNIIGQNDYPTSKYNSMMVPLMRQKLKAILWYQGESDASQAQDYEWKFVRFIEDCRDKWGQPSLPFLYVQLAAFMEEAKVPIHDAWAQLRHAQTLALNVHHTAMISAIDAGDAADIHPKNKQILAARMTTCIKSMMIDRNDVHTITKPSSVKVLQDGYMLSFAPCHGHLHINGSPQDLTFAIPDHAGGLRYAKGSLINDYQVKILAANPTPGMIRYLWSSNPGPVVLYNGADMPVPPFEIWAE